MDKKELALLAGGGAANCIASGLWWLQPILMQQFIARDGLSDAAAGALLTVEVLVLAGASALSTRLLRGDAMLKRLALAAAALTALAGALTLAVQHHYLALMATRAVAGVGEGLVLTIGNRLGARSRDPESMFGKYSLVNILFGVVLLRALDPLAAIAGESAAFLLLAGSTALLLPLLAAIPAADDGLPPERASQAAATSGSTARVWAIAAAMFAISTSSGIIWTYYAVIGQRAGLDGAQVESAIGVAIFASGLAAILAAAVGGRFGRAVPTALGLAVMAGAVFVLTGHPGATAFRVATCLNMGMIYFLLPFLLGAGAAEDARNGAAYVGSAFFLAGAISPLLSGLLVESVGLGFVGTAFVGVAAAVAWLFLRLDRGAARGARLARLHEHS